MEAPAAMELSAAWADEIAGAAVDGLPNAMLLICPATELKAAVMSRTGRDVGTTPTPLGNALVGAMITASD